MVRRDNGCSLFVAICLAGSVLAGTVCDARQLAEEECPPADTVAAAVRSLHSRGWRGPWSLAVLRPLFGKDPQVSVDERARVQGYTWRHSAQSGEQLVCAEGVYLSEDGAISSISVLRPFRTRDAAVAYGSKLVHSLAPAGFNSRYADPAEWADGAELRSWRRIEPLFASGSERPTYVVTVNLDRIGPAWQLGFALGESIEYP